MHLRGEGHQVVECAAGELDAQFFQRASARRVGLVVSADSDWIALAEDYGMRMVIIEQSRSHHWTTRKILSAIKRLRKETHQ